jgi:hypothetical protein
LQGAATHQALTEEDTAARSRSPLEHLRTQWWKQLDAIKWQRSARNAPVDYLGCHMLGEPADGDVNFRFQTLVALMLSPRVTSQHLDLATCLRAVADAAS